MMKKIFFLLAALLVTQNVYAATATATATPKSSVIDDLKERLATKVAEMRQTQKKAIFGTIKAVSVSTITVETKTSDVKIELTDAIQVFQTIKDKRTTLTQDDLAKGDIVSVFGDYDSGLDLLKAKVIVIQSEPPMRISGTITDIDKKEFTVSVDIGEGKIYIVDIEKSTVVFGYNPENGIVKGGFSKLEIGAVALVVGTPVAKKENRISAIRFLDMGNLLGLVASPTPTEMPVASESATPKVTPKPSSTVKTTPTATPAL